MLGLIWAKSCQLPSVADAIPWKSKKPSKIQRLWRFIKNLKVIPKELALISAAEILSGFRGRIIYLTIDRTDIKDKWILFVAVSFRKRALPLIWNVLSKRGATSAKEQRDLLKQLIPLLPDDSQIVLLGDREFRSVSLIRFCKRNDWGFRLRVKNDTWVRHQRKWFQLRDLPLSCGGRPIYLQSAYLTKKRHGPINLACCFDLGEDEPMYVATNQPASGRTFLEFTKRMHIEEMFRDFKEAGFRVHKCRIQVKERLDRLLLIVALAYIFLIHLGYRCIKDGLRTQFEKPSQRIYSICSLGWQYFLYYFEQGRLIRYSFAFGP